MWKSVLGAAVLLGLVAGSASAATTSIFFKATGGVPSSPSASSIVNATTADALIGFFEFEVPPLLNRLVTNSPGTAFEVDIFQYDFIRAVATYGEVSMDTTPSTSLDRVQVNNGVGSSSSSDSVIFETDNDIGGEKGITNISLILISDISLFSSGDIPSISVLNAMEANRLRIVVSDPGVRAGFVTFENIVFAETEEALSTVPVPAALPLFATALGVLGFIDWRRRRTTS